MGPDAGRPHELEAIPWKGPAVGLLDLDAFFASVEQLDHPEWRGRPVIVGGSAGRRGVVSTASYEARAYGVHSAMPSAQAERLCPQAIWTRGRFDRYREMSRRVMDILLAETPLVEQVSIDEAFFDVTPGRFSREHPVAICRRVRDAVAALGVTCSIGLSTSKTVAKIASDKEKPRGLTVVPPGTEALFLRDLPVRDMSGVGPATERTLMSHGIRTLGELAAGDPAEMARLLGVAGPALVERAAGREHSPVRAADDAEEPKSVSNERTFARDLTQAADVEAAVLSAAAKVGTRLRSKGLAGSEVTLKLRFDFEHGRTAQRRLAAPTDDESVFGRAALDLLHEVWRPGVAVRLVGVGVSRFGEAAAPEQPTLFPDAMLGGDGDGRDGGSPAPKGRRELSVALDELRERFGAGAVSYGRDLRLKDETSDTVPMNK